MNKLIRLTLALAAGVVAIPALADGSRTQISSEAAAAHQASVATVQARIAKLLASRTGKAAAAGTQAKTVVNPTPNPGTPIANPFRAYPPSCAADPVPDVVSGPYYSARVNLYARALNSSTSGTEQVTVTIWRIACSSSGSLTPYNTDNGYNAMTFLRIDRDSAYNNDTTFFPTFPQILVDQGNGYGVDTSVVRSALEPNTVISEASYDTPIITSTTYVLENYPVNADYIHYYNYNFKLLVNPNTGNTNDQVEFTVAGYQPNQSDYPDAYAPLFLDGYAAAQWTNGTLGHGLLVQIAEQYDSSGVFSRQLVYDLLLEDTSGNPLWLVGSAVFPVGSTSVTVNASYLGNGLQASAWGTAKFEVEDCNHLNVTYTPNSGLPAPIPSFSGVISYDRLFSANGMLCE